MTVEEAYDLGRRGIVYATHRDAYSGGVVNSEFSQKQASYSGITISAFYSFYLHSELILH